MAALEPMKSGPPMASDGPPLASLRSRFLAALIDSLILAALGMATGALHFGDTRKAMGAHAFSHNVNDNALVEPLQALMTVLNTAVAPLWSLGLGVPTALGDNFTVLRLTVLAVLAYLLVQGWLLAVAGQTLGKRLLKLRVVDKDSGEGAGFKRVVLLRLLLQEALRGVPLYPIVDGLFILRKDRRCLHDWMARTRVVACPNLPLGVWRLGGSAALAGAALALLALLGGPWLPKAVAGRYFYACDWQAGVNYFEQVAAKDPEDAEAYRYEGSFYALIYKEGPLNGHDSDGYGWSQAFGAFNRAIAADPGDVNALLGRGALNYDSAFHDVVSMPSDAGDDRSRWENYGQVQGRLDAHPAAGLLSCTDKELRALAAGHPGWFNAYGFCMEHAMAQQRRAWGQVPSEMHMQLADYYVRLALARQDLRDALGLDPSDMGIRMSLGRALLALQEPQEAELLFGQVQQAQPGNDAAAKLRAAAIEMDKARVASAAPAL